jgi:hypothetical protein
MDVHGRWLGLLVGRGQLEPGNIFMSHNDPFLALRISPAAGHVNTLVLANRNPNDPTLVPRAIFYEPSEVPPEKVRLLTGLFHLEPVSKDLAGLGFDKNARRGFALIHERSIAIHHLVDRTRYVYDLATGKQVKAEHATLLPPQRLIWIDGDDGLELCRF